MYKVLPKKIKEERLIDEIIQNPAALARKSGTKTQPETDMDALEWEVERFIKEARAQHYFAPNSFIPKKDRIKGCFKVIRFRKDLIRAGGQEADRIVAANLLDELFKLMCHACRFWASSSAEPFESVKVSNVDFFHSALSLKFLKTPQMKELSANICSSMLAESNLLVGKKTPDDLKNTLEKRKRTLELIGFFSLMALGEDQAGIDFFYEHHGAGDMEMQWFVLLRNLFHLKKNESWKQEDERALASKIAPRENLEKVYDHILKHGRLPKYC